MFNVKFTDNTGELDAAFAAFLVELDGLAHDDCEPEHSRRNTHRSRRGTRVEKSVPRHRRSVERRGMRLGSIKYIAAAAFESEGRPTEGELQPALAELTDEIAGAAAALGFEVACPG